MRGSWRVFVTFDYQIFVLLASRDRAYFLTFQIYALMLPVSPSASGSSLSRVRKSALLRIALIRYVDALFYEAGDMRWCHKRCYKLLVRDLWDISENTFRLYLRYPSERLAGVEIPPRLRYLVRFYVLLTKRELAMSNAYDPVVLSRIAKVALEDCSRS